MDEEEKQKAIRVERERDDPEDKDPFVVFPVFKQRGHGGFLSTCLDSMDLRVNAEFGQLVGQRDI